jgi:superfamily I DNA/RNA helicase
MKRLRDYERFKLKGYKSEEKKEAFMRKFGITDFSVPFTDTNLFTEGRKWVYAAYVEKYGLDTLEDMCKWNPQILVSTIHHVKGGEARNVAVMLDVTRRTTGNLYKDIDEELRVLYVAITRAKENLFLADSRDGNGYDSIIQTLKEEYGLNF